MTERDDFDEFDLLDEVYLYIVEKDTLKNALLLEKDK